MWIETVGATFFWFSLISMMALIAPILIVWISVSAFYPEKLISRYIVEPQFTRTEVLLFQVYPTVNINPKSG